MNNITQLIAIVFIIFYLSSPIDLIPDVIPGIGCLDDILIAYAVYKMSLKEDEHVSEDKEFID